MRKRRTLYLPLTLSVTLMVINVTLMICWIVMLAQQSSWGALTGGTVAFALVFCGLSFYLFISIKERQLNQRQANFVDSVTHELKSPIAALRLYLETMQMRELDEAKRQEFIVTMELELERLNDLIEQLLLVARLDAVGQASESETVQLDELIAEVAENTSARFQKKFDDIFILATQPCKIQASPMVLEMIFGNLIDNAIKYGGHPPQVEVSMEITKAGRVAVEIKDNGEGVPGELKKRIFRLFYRSGNELHRRQKGTGLGLYIVHTLVKKLKGRIKVLDRDQDHGAIFHVELPMVGNVA